MADRSSRQPRRSKLFHVYCTRNVRLELACLLQPRPSIISLRARRLLNRKQPPGMCACARARSCAMCACARARSCAKVGTMDKRKAKCHGAWCHEAWPAGTPQFFNIVASGLGVGMQSFGVIVCLRQFPLCARVYIHVYRRAYRHVHGHVHRHMHRYEHRHVYRHVHGHAYKHVHMNVCRKVYRRV